MITMYDDINLSLIPANAQAVAGYVNGRWPTYPEVIRMWPKAKHLSIAVSSSADADCLDVEPGDATNIVAPGWVHRQIKRGVYRPCLYTSVSNAAPLLKALAQAGIMRGQVRLWTAHYTNKEHLCGPGCGFGLKTNADATQWTSRALGRSLDQSLCAGGFFDRPPVPAPKPKPAPPPAPKPIPSPKPLGGQTEPSGAYIYTRDKHGNKLWEPLTLHGEAVRYAQWRLGRYQELTFKRK